MGFSRVARLFHSLWGKITFSRLTLIYFIFSVCHFVIQLSLQLQAFSINAKAHHIVNDIVHDAGTVNSSLPFLKGSHLYLCSWVPSNLNTDVADCPIIWRDDEVRSMTTDLDEAISSLRSASSGADKGPINDRELSQQCLWALNWPNAVLQDTQREDSVFIAFQFWVLAVSIRALWNESIPHIIASLLTHIVATAWGALQIMHTAHFRADFNRVITNGACKRTILDTSYWRARSRAEASSLSLNGLALIISCFVTWKLVKVFGWQTFKRIGACRTVNRVYKLSLSLSIIIQLSFFFMAVTISLWIDQLMNSGIGDFASFLTLYKVASFVTLVLLLPWFITGWIGVRRELHLPMLIFLILSVLYLAGWGVMFCSTTFRWTFTTWFFFSVMATASVFLTIVGMVLGVVCRLNFGKGLTRCLDTDQLLYEDRNSTDAEKIAFPAVEEPYAFGSHKDDLTSSFGLKSSVDTTVHFVTFPQSALQRYSGDVETQRSNSSKSSIHSNSHSRKGSSDSNHSQRQRWIIE